MKQVRNGLVLAMAVFALAGCGVLGGKGDKKPRTPTIGQRIPILTSESGVEVEPSLADVEVLLPPTAANSEWNQPGGNAQKSMDHPALGQALGSAWSVGIEGTSKQRRLASPPIIAEGRLYVVDTMAKLHAFDAATGARIWTKQIGNKAGVEDDSSVVSGTMKRNKASLFGGGASYEAGVVYATSGLGDISAFAADTGAVKWNVRPGGPLRGAPGLSSGTLYAMSQDNQIFALNAADGKTIWTESASLETSGVFGAGTPAIAQGTVVAGFSSGELNAYRYENGRSLWSDALSRTSISTSVASLSDVDANPVIDRGRVFAIGQGGRMVSMELVTGQRIWEINIAGISQPWVAGEWVFVVDDQARLLCLTRSNGKVRWISQLPAFRKLKKKKDKISWTGPVLAGERLIVASSDGRLANIDPKTGTLQSVTKAGGSVTIPPVVANNTLYVLTDKGRITAWR